ncbi:YeeE/YedE family protein [Myxococcaceae bacterium JPH2]|nr:YeeE/YedE family protein [Myxococcaceae bacterium JPH2]
MHPFLAALAGGVLIGLSASLLLLFNGRTAGISGITGGLLAPVAGEWGWRAAFVGGLVAGGFLLRALAPGLLGAPVVTGALIPVAAGLLVGFGTRLGNGCTSGHGVCGLAHGAPRSLAATMTFMAAGALTVFVVRHVLGGAA